jgi:hypothetical protein
MKVLFTKMVKRVLAIRPEDKLTSEEIGVLTVSVILMITFAVLFFKATF